jgi:hypothetical protein
MDKYAIEARNARYRYSWIVEVRTRLRLNEI